MRPIPYPARTFLLLVLLLAVPVALAADAPRPLRGPASAAEHAPPSPIRRPGSLGADSAPLATAVTALPNRAVVPPRPSPALVGGEKPFSPRLTGKGTDGKLTVEFPLVHTRVVAQVSGNVAKVEVTQYYANPSSDRLEAVYAFPLPPNAAVTDMLFRVGDRVVLSEVRRREEARAVYSAAKREGRTAALTEQERPNLFTQSVANVPPGETVAVVLRYVHEVPYDTGRYTFHFPTTIGPRYVPGAPLAAGGAGGPGWSPDTDRVPDASRVSPPVVGPGHRAAHDVDLLVRLVPGGAFDDVVTRSHRIVTGLDASGARLVALDEDDRVPNKDFVLSWRPAGAVPAAHALVQRERGEDFLMLFVQPPAEVAPALVRPKELVFLLDKSGSMSGPPIELAKRVVVRALESAGPDDTFQIVAFDGAAQAMTPGPVPVTAANVWRAKAWLALLGGGGGTEMLEGIRAALVPPADPRRLRMVVFCTDGFIGNEAEIIEAVEALRGSARVFGFGIGESVNRFLIEGVGRAGRGAAEVVSLKEEPGDAVARLFSRVDRPVLTDLDVAFEGAEVTELLPERLPDLFAGQPLVLAGRVRGGAPSHVLLRGRLGSGPYAARIPVTPAPAAAGEGDHSTAQPVAGTLWARRRIDALLGAWPAGHDQPVREEAIAIALRFKLVTPYTSFVAVERELRVDPTLPLAQALVPNELPEGLSHEGFFGETGEIEVLPARVKPGDPELRVSAPEAVAVIVKLPFEEAPREAVRDPARGDWVLRFLVPPAWPDGSFDASVTLVGASGAREERVASVRVDTSAAAVAVLSAPRSVRAGETLRLALKPGLRVARLAAMRSRAGGLANALKGEMEVREILVRAPWGETVRARMEGPLGAYVAELRVPAGTPEASVELELVASDAAGNVSRRRLPVVIAAGRAAPAPLEAGMGGAMLTLAALALGGLAAALAATRRGRRAKLVAVALARPGRGEVSLEQARPIHRARRARVTIALLVVAGVAALAVASFAWLERSRLRHLALPLLTDPSEPLATATPLPELPPCRSEELARLGRRVTAVLPLADGALWAGTFDDGLVRIDPDGSIAAVEGLAGRERFVNALAEHDGLVWAATQGGLLALDEGRRAVALLPGEGVTALARAGRRLYAGSARGLFRVSAERGADPMTLTGPGGEPLRVTALAAGAARLWIGTASGAYSIPLAVLDAPLLARTASWHPLVFGAPGAETNVVTALAALEGGALAGTDDGGLVRLLDGGEVAALRFADARANEVNPGAAVASAAGVAVGTQGGGLVLASARPNGLDAGRPSGTERLAISAVAAHRERLFAGTADGRVLALACEPPRS